MRRILRSFCLEIITFFIISIDVTIYLMYSFLNSSFFLSPPTDRTTRYLNSKSWPVGLQKMLGKELSGLANRYFIADDSGTMMFPDGHKVFGTGEDAK